MKAVQLKPFYMVIMLLFTTTYSHAASLDFRARVVEGSCQLDFSDFGNELDLGEMNISEAANGKGYAHPQVPFTINLRNCPQDYPQINLSFQGEVDTYDNRMLALNRQGMSPLQGVGVAFYDLNGNVNPAPIIPINTGRSASIITDADGNAQMQFAAAMIVDGQPLVPGISQPVVSVTINY